jgi:long-chain acyl-CoA synthetase
MSATTLSVAPAARLIAAGEDVGASELVSRVEAVADWLRASRVRVLAWLLDNGLDWAIVDLACEAAGVVAVPLPGFFSDAQLDHVLSDAGADCIVLARPVDAASLRNARSTADLPAALAGMCVLKRDVAVRKELQGVARVTCTSGTTGTPKGVLLDRAAVHQVARSLLDATRSLQLESHLCVLPLPTLLENIAGLLAPLAGGMHVIVPPLADVGFMGGAGLDVKRLVAAIERYRPHSLILLPQLLNALIDAAERVEPWLDSLRFVAVGGAHVSIDLLERARRVGLPVFEGYGLSECASVVALNRPGAHRPGSVGRPLPHARVRIAADGEIMVGGAVTRGYVGGAARLEPEVATGDLGHFDGDGFLYVHGRRRNVFITSWGRNISPEWIESELTASGSIVQAMVVGEARPFNTAIVVPAARGTAREQLEHAIASANERLPDYARVSAYIVADSSWTPANGLATANGRPRRDAIEAIYATRLDHLHVRSA